LHARDFFDDRRGLREVRGFVTPFSEQ